MERLVVIFQSTHNAIRAERLCLASGIAIQAIPVPRELSSDCGIALEIASGDKESVERLLLENSIHAQFTITTKP
jgi:hypothetical protein